MRHGEILLSSVVSGCPLDALATNETNTTVLEETRGLRVMAWVRVHTGRIGCAKLPKNRSQGRPGRRDRMAVTPGALVLVGMGAQAANADAAKLGVQSSRHPADCCHPSIELATEIQSRSAAGKRAAAARREPRGASAE